ncbi:MAG: C45 family autoproteolytic acyltransferase/hydrolase [Pseudomonadota bacterium]
MQIEKLGERRLDAADARAESVLTEWRAGQKRFYTLAQKGSFADCCYDHGRLLAKQIETGVFPEILDTIATDTDASDATERGKLDRLMEALFARITDDLHAACGETFRKGIRALEQGYFDGLADPAFRSRDVVMACLAIDAGNVATGISRLLTRPGHARTASVLDYAIGALMRHGRGRAERNLHTEFALDHASLGRHLAEGLRARPPAGMGCTGFFAGAADTTDGARAVHARTFDGAFFAWNEHPVVHLIDERPTDAGYLRFAAIGTAGLVYPGGISGVNEAGIACSLHQMSTVNFAVGQREDGFEIAPYVQQRILREARSLDEAVAVVRGVKHFASWTILVSDAAKGEAIAIEINGREDERERYLPAIAVRAAAPRVVQTNHFLADALRETFDFWGDAHFTKTLGKWQETRARTETVAARLDTLGDNRLLDKAEALSLMANHDDATVGGASRSLGRTVCKAYGLMGSIALAAKDRAGAPADAIAATIGDRMPGNHATLVSFAIDWAAGTLMPNAPITAQTVTDDRRRALAHYTAAFRIITRPRRPDGRYFARRPTANERRALRGQALAELDRAIALTEAGGNPDPAFRYIRARLSHEAGLGASGTAARALLEQAADDWQVLEGLAAGGAVTLHDWERARIHILAAATDHALGRGDDASREAKTTLGRAAIDRVAAALFPNGAKHPDIKAWQALALKIDEQGAGADLPDIDWVTVE